MRRLLSIILSVELTSLRITKQHVMSILYLYKHLPNLSLGIIVLKCIQKYPFADVIINKTGCYMS